VKPTRTRLLVRLYPRRWRERYGEEFEALLLDRDDGLREPINVAWSALTEHILPTYGGTMNQPVRTFGVVVRQPSAFFPIAMSLVALAIVLGHIALFGVAHEADEGAAAHLWQLLMAGQVPILAFFAIRWLPRAPRPTAWVLALQAGAALASMAPVFFFNL